MTGMAKVEPTARIWYKDPAGFITRTNYLELVPTSQMTYAEQLNAIMRLSTYYAVIVAVLRMRPESFVLPIAAGLGTYLMYEGSGGEEGERARAYSRSGQTYGGAKGSAQRGWRQRDGGSSGAGGGDDGDDESCVRPTRHNPFMNQMNEEPMDRPPACSPLDPEVKQEMRDKFREDLFRDVSDVWERGNSERQFHTMPVTSQPNDQAAFAEWVYGDVRRGGRASRPPAVARVCEW
jgi:hypothetical protein